MAIPRSPPIWATSAGASDWSIGLELRGASHHSPRETEYFHELLFPRVERLVPADQPLLLRDDSSFGSARLLFAKCWERARWSEQGRRFEFIIKWNPRKQNKADWGARGEAEQGFVEARGGKWVALFSVPLRRSWRKQKQMLRLVVQVTQRTIDKRGQCLLAAEITLEGWWTRGGAAAPVAGAGAGMSASAAPEQSDPAEAGGCRWRAVQESGDWPSLTVRKSVWSRGKRPLSSRNNP